MNYYKVLLISIFIIFFGCTSTNTNKSLDYSSIEEKNYNENSPDPEALKFFMEGQMLMNQGDFSMAVIELQQASELDPEISAIKTAIAECYWRLGKKSLSRKYLNDALKIDPMDDQAMEMLVDQMIINKEYESAIIPLIKLNKKFPDKTKYIITLGEIEKIRGNFLESIDYYLKAFESQPENLELLETAGRYSLESNNVKKAILIFKKLSKEAPERFNYLSIYTDLISREKKFQEGILHIELLNEENGFSAFRNAELGQLYYRFGKQAKARKLLEESVSSLQDNKNYYFSLFDIYMNIDDLSLAKDIADKLIANFPDDWRGYYSRAVVYMNQEDFGSIVSFMAPIAERFNDIFSIQYILGLGYNKLNEKKNAELYYQKALKVRPDSRNVLHSLAILYDEIKDWEKSDSIYVKLINIDDKDAQAYNNYAYSLVERNLFLPKALEMAKKAISLEPNNASYLDTIGWIYFKMDKLGKAKKFVESSIEINSENAIVLEHLGDILMSADQTKNALELYKKALLLDKDNTRLKQKVNPD